MFRSQMRRGCGRSARLPAWHEDREVCWSEVEVVVVVVVAVVVVVVVEVLVVVDHTRNRRACHGLESAAVAASHLSLQNGACGASAMISPAGRTANVSCAGERRSAPPHGAFG